jgi:hypothetical protein
MPLCSFGFHNINAGIKRNFVFTQIYDPRYKTTLTKNLPIFRKTAGQSTFCMTIRQPPIFQMLNYKIILSSKYMGGRIPE